MTQQELDKIDLELFKVCYPDERNAQIGQFKDDICYGEHGYTQFVPCFTKDIGVCFSVLIHEMNRRGWRLNNLYQSNNGKWCAEFEHDATDNFKFVYDTQPQTAIATAAYEALKSEGVVKC